MTDVRAHSEQRFRNIVYGLAAAATLTYAGWLGSAVFEIGEKNNDFIQRLTRIEVTIDENKDERRAQIIEIRERITDLERAVYGRRERE